MRVRRQVIRELLDGLTLPKFSAAGGACTVCPAGSAPGTWGCSSTAADSEKVGAAPPLTTLL